MDNIHNTWRVFYKLNEVFFVSVYLDLTAVSPMEKINKEVNISSPECYSWQCGEGFETAFKPSR